MGSSVSYIHLFQNGLGNHVACQQLWGSPCTLVALQPTMRFLWGRRSLVSETIRSVAKHEPLTITVKQDSAFTTYTFSNQDTPDA